MGPYFLDTQYSCYLCIYSKVCNSLLPTKRVSKERLISEIYSILLILNLAISQLALSVCLCPAISL